MKIATQLKASSCRHCRIRNTLYLSIAKAARKLKLSEFTVRARLHSPYWYNWRYLTENEIKKAYQIPFKPKIWSPKSKLKMSKPFFVGDKIYISRYDCCEDLGYAHGTIGRRLKSEKFPEWRLATPQEIQHALDNGLFIRS